MSRRFLALFLALFISSMARGESSAIITYDPHHVILGLQFDSIQTAGEEHLVIRGTFSHPSWQLFWEDRPLSVSDNGRFSIPLRTPKHSTALKFTARGPGHETQTQIIELSNVPWVTLHARKQNTALPVVVETAPQPQREIANVGRYDVWGDPLPDEGPHYYLISEGFNLLTYPQLSFERTLDDKASIGILLTTLNQTVESSYGSAYGGMLTLTYFLDKAFSGLALQAAGGLYFANLKAGGMSKLLPEPTVRAVALWRWAANPIDISFGAGVQYFYLAKSSVTASAHQMVQPVAQIDAGILF